MPSSMSIPIALICAEALPLHARPTADTSASTEYYVAVAPGRTFDVPGASPGIPTWRSSQPGSQNLELAGVSHLSD